MDQERADYLDHDRPPQRLLARLSRRRWLWLLLLVIANLGAAGGWYAYKAGPQRTDGEQHDPIEDDPKFRPILVRANLEAEQELAARGITPRLGYCHAFWHTKKRILKDKYGINWRTPAELNPDWAFD